MHRPSHRISITATYPSVVSGAFSMAVFSLSVMALLRFTDVEVERALLPFAAGFLVYMVVYFFVMIVIEPYLRW